MATSASSTDVADDGALATTLTTPLASASEPVTVVGSAAASSASSSVDATPNSTGSATGTASPAAHAPTPAGVHKKNLEDVVELKRRRLAAQLRQINRAETALFAKYARFTDSHLVRQRLAACCSRGATTLPPRFYHHRHHHYHLYGADGSNETRASSIKRRPMCCSGWACTSDRGHVSSTRAFCSYDDGCC